MQTRRRTQRGATMVSVMLLTVSLLTVGVLVMSSAQREVTEAGALVARERAVMVAQGAIDLAAARSLLTFAFANDIIGRVKIDGIRGELEDALLTAQHLPKYQDAPEALP